MPGLSTFSRALGSARGRSHDLVFYFLAISSGVLLSLAFPRPSLWPLIFVGLIPLLFACQGRELKSAFGFGYLTGLVHAGTLLYWLVKVLTFYGGLHLVVALPVFFLLVGYISLYPALFMLGLSLCEKGLKAAPGGLSWVLAGAVIYTGLEYLKGIFLSGLPWEPLGAALMASLSLVQFSDIVGTGGLTFIVVAVNLSLFALVLRWQAGDLKAVLIRGAVILIALCGLWGYGHFRLAVVKDLIAAAPSHKVAIAQGNIDQLHKWDPVYRVSILKTYQDLTLRAAEENPWLIIWPEAATPFFFLKEQGGTTWLKALVKRVGKPLLFGSPAYEEYGDDEKYYNRVYLVDRHGEVKGYYDKVRLVPYGEFVPLKRFFPFLGKITQAVGDYFGGEKSRLIEFGEERIGVLICYESLFSGLVRDQVVKGADFLVNPTNDAWFGRTSAPHQLLHQSALRAVENRRPMIRAANTGISAIIWPTGEIKARLGSFEQGVVSGLVPRLSEKTVYTAIGDLIPQVCLVVAIIVIAAGIIRRRRDACGSENEV
ncbi:MAG: apolipoprotein N-acyltransferase [Deltaproteobacteria bacterium]|nr:apolipoprotein N-acyltransferase [Deltaproteobacteria bacterium]